MSLDIGVLMQDKESPDITGGASAISGDREFRYFPRFYIISFFMTLFFAGIVLISWIPILLLYLFKGQVYEPVVRAAMYLSGTFLLLLILGERAKKDLAATRIVVSGDGIKRVDRMKQTVLLWRDVASVRCVRLPFVKAFVEVSTPQSSLVLPSTIQDFAALGVALQSGLMRSGKSALCNAATLRVFSAMGTVSELWNERARKAYWPLVFSTVASAFVNLGIAGFIWGAHSFPLVVWTAVSLPIPLLIYSHADVRLNRRLERSLIEGSPYDAAQDFKAELLTGFLFVALAYGVLGIVFKGIFQT